MLDHSRTNPAYSTDKEVSVPVHTPGKCIVQQARNGAITVLWTEVQRKKVGAVIIENYANRTAHITDFFSLLVLLARVDQPTQYVIPTIY